jgi:hypothetical protein
MDTPSLDIFLRENNRIASRDAAVWPYGSPGPGWYLRLGQEHPRIQGLLTGMAPTMQIGSALIAEIPGSAGIFHSPK